MGELSNFSAQCFEKCPGLHSCASEFVLRQANGEGVTLADVISEHQANGTLPEECDKGPVVSRPNMLGSKATADDIAFATDMRIDGWGDIASVRCRSQARVGGGKISPQTD